MGRSCLTYAPARMNRKVVVQVAVNTGDGQGGFTESWADETTVFADLRPVKGWEKYQAMQVQTPVTHKVTIRYLSGLTTAKRLLYGTRVFDIKEVLDRDEDHAFMDLTCVEKQ